MQYYLGVDGGGTKTSYVLFNNFGEILDAYIGLGTNHELLHDGFDGTINNIVSASMLLLQKKN